ncbi:hypothetical protein ACFPOE_11195 [Caenimonas terrae]|uniref:Uncharacterized protein n=1 Tax=Caenimonas terrae TaxID=696074 RepID=A0ABW0NDU4_9BURK
MNQSPRKGSGKPPGPTDLVRAGRSGEGAGSVMDEIARDRLAAARAATHTAEQQIKALWRLRVPQDRTIADLWTLQTWLSANAPDLLADKGDSFQYLLALLASEIDPGGGPQQD